MSKEQSGKGILERGTGFFEKLHYGIGAAALVGAAIFPAEAAGLAVFGVYEFVHGALWGYLKNRAGKKPKPSPSPA